MKLRLGLAGYGRRGRGHVAALRSEPRAELTAVFDPAESARRAAAADFSDASVFESVEEMVDSGSIDAVIIAAPAHLNGVCARALIVRGVSTLIEKPPGLSVEEVEDLHDTAKASGAKVMVAFNRRFNPLVRAAIREVKEYGPVHQVVAEFHKDIHDFTGDRRYSPRIMDLMLLESPIHAVDLLIHMADSRVAEVHSVVRRAASDYRDAHAALIEFENGVLCQFTAAYTAGGRLERYELHGEYVSAYLEGVHEGWIIRHNGRHAIDFHEDTRSDIEAQDSYFVRCLLKGTDFGPPAADLESSVETLKLCESILRGTRAS